MTQHSPSNLGFRVSLTLCLAIFLQVCGTSVTAQEIPDSLHSQRAKKKALIFGGSGLYVSSMVGLNELWYKDFPRTSFHSFNDNDEWLQIDKCGHFMSSYYIGLIGHEALSWAGVEKRKAQIIGGLVGTMFLTGIEVLDGFSTEWGFSWGDQAANLGGSAFYIGQELLWEEQRIKLKFSSNPTHLAQIRPEVLGSTWSEQIFKDYNGQTYWASANLSSFIPNSGIPEWLCLSVGYGGHGMVRSRMIEILDQYSDINQHRRQYYFSFDIDLTKIETKSVVIRTLTKAFGFIKIPAPTIEWNQGGKPQYYWLYF